MKRSGGASTRSRVTTMGCRSLCAILAAPACWKVSYRRPRWLRRPRFCCKALQREQPAVQGFRGLYARQLPAHNTNQGAAASGSPCAGLVRAIIAAPRCRQAPQGAPVRLSVPRPWNMCVRITCRRRSAARGVMLACARGSERDRKAAGEGPAAKHQHSRRQRPLHQPSAQRLGWRCSRPLGCA